MAITILDRPLPRKVEGRNQLDKNCTLGTNSKDITQPTESRLPAPFPPLSVSLHLSPSLFLSLSFSLSFFLSRSIYL